MEINQRDEALRQRDEALRQRDEALRQRDEAIARAVEADARTEAATAETARADAMTARLWLYLFPDMNCYYQEAVKYYGRQQTNRNMREAVERGEWKMPERKN